ncbi:uncharacterized protein BDZ99DRAFT_155983 [Mytilinidion resinicola]|uniref:C3H1-type domain-containing protein n=1 Tax=Mytilinidion resinicola TaxID=574789 RepID=A0A6A6Y5M8_9PEZI|nr:uncharacterized protein BDZ99DRAFT_155983 [Mytilinidion resinicola]KAF2803929.1 hypothetical protein BDZ99DRAFT_155983 [Mytilinidion resinicola]
MSSPRGTKRRADDPDPHTPYTGFSCPLSAENTVAEFEKLRESIRLRNQNWNNSRLLSPPPPPRHPPGSRTERPMASGSNAAGSGLQYESRDGACGSANGPARDDAAQRRGSLEEGEIEGDEQPMGPTPPSCFLLSDRHANTATIGSSPPLRSSAQDEFEDRTGPTRSFPAGRPTVTTTGPPPPLRGSAYDEDEDRMGPPVQQIRPALKTVVVNGASIPITCRWWKFGAGRGGCHNTAETCQYAHFDTGLYAEDGPRSQVSGSRKRAKKKRVADADPGKPRRMEGFGRTEVLM